MEVLKSPLVRAGGDLRLVFSKRSFELRNSEARGAPEACSQSHKLVSGKAVVRAPDSGTVERAVLGMACDQSTQLDSFIKKSMK